MSIHTLTTTTGNPVELRTIPSLRMAFAFAGLLILIGLIGQMFLHSLFIILPYLVAGGLLFSAISGWCPMATVMNWIYRSTKNPHSGHSTYKSLHY